MIIKVKTLEFCENFMSTETFSDRNPNEDLYSQNPYKKKKYRRLSECHNKIM